MFGSQNEPSCANSDSYVEVNHASTWVAYTEWKPVNTNGSYTQIIKFENSKCLCIKWKGGLHRREWWRKTNKKRIEVANAQNTSKVKEILDLIIDFIPGKIGLLFSVISKLSEKEPKLDLKIVEDNGNEWKKVATETALKHARVVSSNVINCYHTSANVTFIGEFPYAGAMSYNTPGKYDATWRNETERKEVFKRLDLPIVD